MAEIGALLGGKYRLLRLVGKGGMGAVYEAEHERIGKRVAIKVVNPALSSDANLTARLEREARAAASTGHRNVIDIYDVGEDVDGSLFLVMELLEGESLGRLLWRGSALEIPFVAGVSLQVLSALQAVHEKGVLHRDLKPDNVFLVPSGLSVPDVKILDFGASKMEKGVAADRITKTGVIIGTPAYMAPEQLLGRPDLDERVDIYAVGVILYECLTGVLPFEAESVYALVERVLHAPLRPARELVPDLPDGLDALVLRAMARDREERFESAAAMARALLPFVGQDLRGRSFPPLSMASFDPEPAGARTTAEAATLQGTVRGTAGTDVPGPRRARVLLSVPIFVVLVAGAIAGLLLLGPSRPVEEPGVGAPAAGGGNAPAAPRDAGPGDPGPADRADAAPGDAAAGDAATGPDGGPRQAAIDAGPSEPTRPVRPPRPPPRNRSRDGGPGGPRKASPDDFVFEERFE